MPPSLTMKSSSPTRSGDGVSGAPRFSVQATCVFVTSPVPSGAHREQRRLLKPGRDVDEAVPEHRTRHVGEAVGVAHAPDLLAGLRIVGGRAIRADADELVAVADPDHERRRIRLVPRLAPRRFPADFPGPLVERDDERLVAAVAAEDQQIAVQHRRPAVAVLRLVRETRLPDDLAGGGQRGGAFGAEMHVDAVAVDDRASGRRGCSWGS